MPVISSLSSQLRGYRRLLLAFSGGLDSTVLLHRLMLLRQRQPEVELRAVHIHHGLSASADSWAAHCCALCRQWQIPCEVIPVDLTLHRDLGSEGAARQARYQALHRIQQQDELLLTAQHLDDQTETFLLALKRGSGPAGLAAMPAWLERTGKAHCRPLLTESRAALEQWAQCYQLSWVEDESNQDSRYDRNFLRREIVPALQRRWPHFSEMTARSAALCGEQEALLDELLAPQLAGYQRADGGFMSAPLHAMSAVHRQALLRRWIAAQGGMMPSRDLLQRLWQEVVLSREDASPRLQWGRQVIRRYRHTLYLHPAVEQPLPHQILWPSPWHPLALPAELGWVQQSDEGGVWLRAPEPEEVVTVRFQAQGEFTIAGRAGRRALKKLWQELGVPPWLRTRTPLIFYHQTLIAALGVFVTRDGEVAADNKKWQLQWLRNQREI